jgi:hypothetical protein
MNVGYYWPNLFADMHAYVRTCDPCQRFEGKQRLPAPPLDPIIVQAPFQQVGNLVLLWDKKNEKSGDRGKFDSLWLGPYLIDAVEGSNTFYLSDSDSIREELP